jgi:hypothetical protein
MRNVCLSWSDDRVEQYLQNQLSSEENQRFEQHVLRCSACQERIEDEMNSLLALRRAALAQPLFGYSIPISAC